MNHSDHLSSNVDINHCMTMKKSIKDNFHHYLNCWKSFKSYFLQGINYFWGGKRLDPCKTLPCLEDWHESMRLNTCRPTPAVQVCGCIYGQTERRGRVIFGIQTEVSEKFCWAEFLRSSGVSSEHVDELRVFLLVCGLRRVKDPLYLVEVFSEWHRENPLNVLVVIGPQIDPVFTVEVEAVVKNIIHASVSPESRRTEFCRCFCRTAGVFLAQERSQRELHAAMKRCFTVVNSSVSEGMSAAILEAMDLGVPVCARDIPGNAAVVHHEFTGLLYSSPQEFVHQSQRLLSDHELRERVVRNGKLYVEEHHGLKQERETYQRLVDTLLLA
ncbi:glycosyltransferase 1 domain-containing protein 1 isoform X3 [Anarrhichthys ocellatus]|uniref:glycosyltransferase 1 domain-containing protein 1 isoform X3 n=1 Tax=Anarrhichthys ocellatus TaxID=433405 RepID=UPI0012ED810C|nr:glycosyltransferase 1 domain-containing protein 1 isoform X3 [Anarrhichthys ocellatus]